MFGQGLNIFNIEENQISSDISQYSMIMTSKSGDGKTTAMFKILNEMAKKEGKKVAFLMTENRFQHLEGIFAIPIKSYNDFETAKQQLITPQAKEMFYCIVIDTMDKLDVMINKFVADSKNVEITGDIGFGRGGKYLESKLSPITELKNHYTVHYVCQAEEVQNFATGKKEIVPKLSKEMWKQIYTDCYLCAMLNVNAINGERTLTFKKTAEMPLLKDSIGMPISVKIEDFNKELLNGVKKLAKGKLVDKKTITGVTETRNFDEMKRKVKELGKRLYELNFGAEATVCMNTVLGKDESGNQIGLDNVTPNQLDLMEMILIKIGELAILKGIK